MAWQLTLLQVLTEDILSQKIVIQRLQALSCRAMTGLLMVTALSLSLSLFFLCERYKPIIISAEAAVINDANYVRRLHHYFRKNKDV